MTPAEFTNLYTQKSDDESVTTFQNEVGFSLIRLYPDGTEYRRDGRRMFIKVAALDRGLFYSVEMTSPEERGGAMSYIIVEGNEYRRKTTNFMSGVNEPEFSFDDTQKMFIHLPTKKKFSMNDFVEILAKNHLSDRLFWKRILNSIVSFFLQILFWLSDRHYERIKVAIDKYHAGRDGKPLPEEVKNIEPFFKYFYISKNILFASLLIAFPSAVFLGHFWSFGDFSLSNPSIILLGFLILFSGEKFSIYLDGKIKDLFAKETFQKNNNFIEKLHEYQFRNEFKLKI